MSKAYEEPLIEPHLAPPQYPKGFRARRGQNWAFLGLMYTSYYMCRYNLSIANPSIRREFNFDKVQMGTVITTTLVAYAVGQVINGLLTDKLGGKRAMLIGATGTVVMNVLFGIASFWGQLSLFTLIWGFNGYMQAFGAPGMIKVNAAWFQHQERGRFAGIFGFMINLGRFVIYNIIGPALITGSVLWGLFQIQPLHWRWLFWIPAMVVVVVAVGVVLMVKDTPEEAGFNDVVKHPGEPDTNVRADFASVLKAILTSKSIWIVALAYSCTGAVRQGIDQWFPSYMEEYYHTKLDSAQYQWTAFLIPFVASAGSLASGYISDMFFKSKRSPVAAILYLVEGFIILLAAQFHTATAAVIFLVLISLTANSTHSILGTAAAMDIGGRRYAGFASGLIDSFQYLGGALAGIVLGYLVEHVGWGSYFYFMAPFGFIGCTLMALNKDEGRAKASGAH